VKELPFWGTELYLSKLFITFYVSGVG